MRPLMLFITFLFSVPLLAQENFTISGTVKLKSTGETVIGATIRSGKTGTVSNEYGFYSLTLPKGKNTLEVSSIGQETKKVDVTLEKNTILNVSLEDA